MSTIATKELFPSTFYADQGRSTERSNVQPQPREGQEARSPAKAPMLSSLASRTGLDRTNVKRSDMSGQVPGEWSEEVLSSIFSKLGNKPGSSRASRVLAGRLMDGFLTDLRSSGRDSVAARLEGRLPPLAEVDEDRLSDEGRPSVRTTEEEGEIPESELRNYIRQQTALALERAGLYTGRPADALQALEGQHQVVQQTVAAHPTVVVREPDLEPMAMAAAHVRLRRRKQVDDKTIASRRMAVYEPQLSPMDMAMAAGTVPAPGKKKQARQEMVAAGSGEASERPGAHGGMTAQTARAPQSSENPDVGVDWGASTSTTRGNKNGFFQQERLHWLMR